MFIRNKKIKYSNKLYNIKTDTYPNGRLKIYLKNNKEELDVTINLLDINISDGNVFLDPAIMNNGIFRALKKSRIINRVVYTFNYNYVDIPVAVINMGKLRECDAFGVSRHLEQYFKNRGDSIEK